MTTNEKRTIKKNAFHYLFIIYPHSKILAPSIPALKISLAPPFLRWPGPWRRLRGAPASFQSVVPEFAPGADLYPTPPRRAPETHARARRTVSRHPRSGAGASLAGFAAKFILKPTSAFVLKLDIMLRKVFCK